MFFFLYYKFGQTHDFSTSLQLQTEHESDPNPGLVGFGLVKFEPVIVHAFTDYSPYTHMVGCLDKMQNVDKKKRQNDKNEY